MFNAVSSPVSVGSVVFSVLALLVVSLVVLLVLRHYLPLRSTPGFYLIPIFFALWLPSIIVLLVPIDLASSAGTDDEATRGIWLPDRVVLVSWRMTYWLSFALTWYALNELHPTWRCRLQFNAGLFFPYLANTRTPATANHETNCYTPYERTPSSTP